MDHCKTCFYILCVYIIILIDISWFTALRRHQPQKSSIVRLQCGVCNFIAASMRGSSLLSKKQLLQSETLHWQAESTVQRADGVMRYTVITITRSELLPAWDCTSSLAQQSSRTMCFSVKLMHCTNYNRCIQVIVHWGSAWKFKAMHFKLILLFSAAMGSFGPPWHAYMALWCSLGTLQCDQCQG